MKLIRSLVTSFVILFALTGCSGLSRDKALELIEATVKADRHFGGVMQAKVGSKFSYPVNYYVKQGTENTLFTGSLEYQNNLDAQRKVTSGLVDVINGPRRNGFGGTIDQPYHTALGKAAAPFVVSSKQECCGETTYVITRGTVENIQVTGIEEVSDKAKRANFTYDLRRNPVAQKFDGTAEVSKYQAQASFQKYDDGWRLVSIDKL